MSFSSTRVGKYLLSGAAEGLEEPSQHIRMPIGTGFAGRVAAERRTIALEDSDAADILDARLREKQVRSLLGAPLIVEGRVIGVLRVGTVRAHRFTEDEKRLLQVVADRMALVIEHVRLYEAEQRARREAESLAAERDAILRQIADGVVIADPSGSVVFANDVARRLLGLTESGIPLTLRSEGYQVLTPDGGSYTSEELPLARAARQGDVIVDAELRIRHPDGTERVAQGSAVPVIAEDGTRCGAVLTLHDVTAQRELERQKEEFFANASHDLRTPVTTIKASIDVVLENEPSGTPEPVHRLLTNINREAERMATLVNDLLELTRLQTGRVQLDLAQHDLRVVAQSAASAIEQLAHERGQHIELVLPTRAVMARVDAGHLERALLNLVANAHRYGREGGVIRLRLPRRNKEAVFAVEDDGPGIAKADQGRIFERFYRPGNEATRRDQGSGLGLPIARAMVELHGGRIWVESVPGNGSTFRIALLVATPDSKRRRKPRR